MLQSAILIIFVYLLANTLIKHDEFWQITKTNIHIHKWTLLTALRWQDMYNVKGKT